MSESNLYDGITNTVQVLSDEVKMCEHCSESVGGEDVAKSINHYINDHGYKLIHVGQQTGVGQDGSFQMTTALLGK